MDGTDNDRLISVSPFFHHGKQVVLRAQLAHQHVAAEEAYLTNPPVASFRIQNAIGQ